MATASVRPRRLAPAERERLRTVTETLFAAYPDANCALAHEAPHELLVATILSAQCTDERVNLVTPALFARFPTPLALADAPLADLETLIHSTGFFRNKAKNIKGAMRAVVDTFGDTVPRTMEELLTLPGVARKTANVVLGTSFGIAEGVVVDTHVMRLSNRLRYTKHGDPVKIERDLIDIVPRESWIAFSHTLILHGRQVCDARRPACGACVVRALCPSALPATANVAKGRARKAVAATKAIAAKATTAKKVAAAKAVATKSAATNLAAKKASATTPSSPRPRRAAGRSSSTGRDR